MNKFEINLKISFNHPTCDKAVERVMYALMHMNKQFESFVVDVESCSWNGWHVDVDLEDKAKAILSSKASAKALRLSQWERSRPRADVD